MNYSLEQFTRNPPYELRTIVILRNNPKEQSHKIYVRFFFIYFKRLCRCLNFYYTIYVYKVIPKISIKELLINLALLVLFVFVMNALALLFSWYWIFWWFDMPMHFLGGLFLGGLGVYAFIQYFLKKNTVLWKPYTWFKNVFLFVICISVAWELYEFIVDQLFKNGQPNVIDTLSDLFFDTAGGMTALLFLYIKSIFIEE